MLVFCEDRLYQYWDSEGSFRAAFCRWGQEIIDAMNKRSKPLDDGLSIDLAEIAFALSPEWDGLAQNQLLRAVILPHHKDGTTITQIARATDQPVSVIVGALFNPAAERNFSRYVYGERWILTYGSTATHAKMQRATLLPRDAVRLLCERHHVQAARYTHERKLTSEVA